MTLDRDFARRALTIIKSHLSEQGVTYPQIAAEMGLSLATIKRIMNSDDLSLTRLFELCTLAHLNPADIVAKVQIEPAKKVRSFTEEEEQFFVRHPGHLGYFRELQGGSSPGTIARSHGLSKRSTTAYLRNLAEAGFIRVCPGHKVKVLVPFSGTWRKGGPLARLHLQGIRDRALKRQELRDAEETRVQNLSAVERANLPWMSSLWLTYARPKSYLEYLRTVRDLTTKFIHACGYEATMDKEENLSPVLLSLFVDSDESIRELGLEAFAIMEIR
jgi:DNA-binding CsgD family transcriptional regulator